MPPVPSARLAHQDEERLSAETGGAVVSKCTKHGKEDRNLRVRERDTDLQAWRRMARLEETGLPSPLSIPNQSHP